MRKVRKAGQAAVEKVGGHDCPPSIICRVKEYKGVRRQQVYYENIIDVLLGEVPELRALFNAHLRKNGGECLPHVFFGDMTRFVLGLAQDATVPNDRSFELLKRILEFLEVAMASPDPRVQNLVSVSFVENLGPMSDSLAKVRTMLGRKLSEELVRYWGPRTS
jgi:hypothetical protein